MFPRERVIASLRKYEISFDPDEETEPLDLSSRVSILVVNLLKVAITPADQAETAYFLLSTRSARTTGQVVAVDGGLDGCIPAMTFRLLTRIHPSKASSRPRDKAS